MSSPVRIGSVLVHGVAVDAVTGCAHYRSAVDVVAIRFFCCRKWYSCLHCHRQHADHMIRPWPATAASERAILCGRCGTQIAIACYRATDRCPQCSAAFNTACRVHHAVYFEGPVDATAAGGVQNGVVY